MAYITATDLVLYNDGEDADEVVLNRPWNNLIALLQSNIPLNSQISAIGFSGQLTDALGDTDDITEGSTNLFNVQSDWLSPGGPSTILNQPTKTSEFIRDIEWMTVSGNTTLSGADQGKTLYVTANANITLPAYSSIDDTWNIEIMPDDSRTNTVHTITLILQGADTMRASETTVNGDSSVVATPITGTFLATGMVS